MNTILGYDMEKERGSKPKIPLFPDASGEIKGPLPQNQRSLYEGEGNSPDETISLNSAINEPLKPVENYREIFRSTVVPLKENTLTHKVKTVSEDPIDKGERLDELYLMRKNKKKR